jgi:ribosome-associated protein
METLDKARLCLKIIKERKALTPVLMEIGQLTTIADYFLIAGGNSTRQVQAISQHMAGRMREEGFKAFGVEGAREGQWILMDYGDVVVHIFYGPVREFYDLEGLWIEATRIEMDESTIQKT